MSYVNLNHGTAFTRIGDRIHRNGCSQIRKAKRPVYWNFAQGMTDWHIALAMKAAPWLRACRYCLADLPNVDVKED